MELGGHHRRSAIQYVVLAAPRLVVRVLDGQVLEHVIKPRRHRQVVVWFQTGLVGLLFSGVLLSEDNPIFRAAKLGPRDEPRMATPDLLPN